MTVLDRLCSWSLVRNAFYAAAKSGWFEMTKKMLMECNVVYLLTAIRAVIFGAAQGGHCEFLDTIKKRKSPIFENYGRFRFDQEEINLAAFRAGFGGHIAVTKKLMRAFPSESVSYHVRNTAELFQHNQLAEFCDREKFYGYALNKETTFLFNFFTIKDTINADQYFGFGMPVVRQSSIKILKLLNPRIGFNFRQAFAVTDPENFGALVLLASLASDNQKNVIEKSAELPVKDIWTVIMGFVFDFQITEQDKMNNFANRLFRSAKAVSQVREPSPGCCAVS